MNIKKASQQQVEETVIGYLKWAEKNPKTLLANAAAGGRRDKDVITTSVHTVYTKPKLADGTTLPSLNDALRNIGIDDPVGVINDMVHKKVIMGRLIKGGFSISFPKVGVAGKMGTNVSTIKKLEMLLAEVS